MQSHIIIATATDEGAVGSKIDCFDVVDKTNVHQSISAALRSICAGRDYAILIKDRTLVPKFNQALKLLDVSIRWACQVDGKVLRPYEESFYPYITSSTMMDGNEVEPNFNFDEKGPSMNDQIKQTEKLNKGLSRNRKENGSGSDDDLGLLDLIEDLDNESEE